MAIIATKDTTAFKVKYDQYIFGVSSATETKPLLSKQQKPSSNTSQKAKAEPTRPCHITVLLQ